MKKILKIAAIILSAVFIFTGCGNEEGPAISNEYVDIVNYKDLEIPKIVAVEVTDREVEAEIKARIAAHDIKAEVKNRGSISGDTVVFDCAALIDNVAYADLTVDNQYLKVGEETFVEGFDENLLDRTEGEEYEFDMTLPDPYIQDESLSGAEIHWIVTIEKIYEGDMPELTDAFVKNQLMIPGVNTAKQYEEYIREKLENIAQRDARYAKEQKAWEAVYANTILKGLPEGQVDAYVERTTEAYEEYAKNEGLTFDEYMDRMGTTAFDFKEEMTEAAQKVVIQSVIFDAIAQAEGLTVDDTEYENSLEAFAIDNGYGSSKELTALYGPIEIKDAMMQSKVLKFLVDNADEESSSGEFLSPMMLIIVLAAACVVLLLIIIIIILTRNRKSSGKKAKSKRTKNPEALAQPKETSVLDENGYNPELEVPDPEEEKSLGDTQTIETPGDYEINSYDPAIESDPMVKQNK